MNYLSSWTKSVASYTADLATRAATSSAAAASATYNVAAAAVVTTAAAVKATTTSSTATTTANTTSSTSTTATLVEQQQEEIDFKAFVERVKDLESKKEEAIVVNAELDALKSSPNKTVRN